MSNLKSQKLSGPRGRFYTTWKFMRDPYACYRSWKQQYGDTFLVKALNGNVVATCNTENIRQLFALPTNDLKQFAPQTIRPLVGDQSLFILEGEAHRRERKLISPAFHGQRIESKADEIRDVAFSAANVWDPGQIVRIMDATLEVSLEVIIRVVFGVQSPERVAQLNNEIKNFVSAFHPSLAFSRLLHRPMFGLSPWVKFSRASDRFRLTLMEEINKCRKQPLDEDNMLSVLLHSKYEDGAEVHDAKICDQLVTMLLAGHETTQIALAWAMSWLHRHPEFKDRMIAELDEDDSIGAIMSSDLLEGICNESLRLNPVIPDVVRTLTRAVGLENHELQSGTNVSIAICLIHEDPEIYPDPFAFNPDRWNGRDYKTTEFMPFGGGIRRCPGAPLAILEMKIVIATWLKHFRFELPDDIPGVEPTHRRNVTMAPKTGIPLVFTGNRGS